MNLSKSIFLALLLSQAGCTQYKKLIGQDDGSSHNGIVNYFDGITIIGTGQSNSTQPLNGGAPVYSTTGMVEVIYENDGVLPEFTIPTREVPFSHNAAWVRLGDMLAAQTGKRVRIVNVGFGNTSTRKWQQYIPNLKAAVEKYRPDAVCWVQGESDFFHNLYFDDDITADEAYQNMRNIIDASRGAMRGVKWWVALDGLIPVPHSREQAQVRVAQRRLIAEGAVYQGPDIDEIRWTNPELFGSSIQGQQAEFVGDAGHETHAKAWFEIIKGSL